MAPAAERRADGWHLDLRGLAPPQPLVAVLRLVATIDDATPVWATFERDPVMLYPELAERGWAAERVDAPAGAVRLRLAPAAGA